MTPGGSEEVYVQPGVGWTRNLHQSQLPPPPSKKREPKTSPRCTQGKVDGQGGLRIWPEGKKGSNFCWFNKRNTASLQ